MANLYMGSERITPAFYSENESVPSGDIIVAVNNSSNAITSGSKVWLNKSDNNYSIIDFYLKQVNGIIQGNISIDMNSGIASNFSNGFIHVDGYGENSNGTIIMKVTTGDNISGTQEILRFEPSVEIFIKNGNLVMWTDSENHEVTCTSVNINTTYWIKLVLNNGIVTFTYSLDGNTYSGTTSMNCYTNNNKTYIGNFTNSYESIPFLGTIDLLTSNFYLNDSEYWRGISKSINPSLSEANTITGKALQNIAVNGSGNISIING